MNDPGRYLQFVRTLRNYAAKGVWEAQVNYVMVCSSLTILSHQMIDVFGKYLFVDSPLIFKNALHFTRLRWSNIGIHWCSCIY